MLVNVARVVSRTAVSKHSRHAVFGSHPCHHVAHLLRCCERGACRRSADAENPGACQRVTSGIEEVSSSEPTGVGAGIVLDEHLLTNGSRDQDYNGGGELTFSGERGGSIGRTLDRALGFVDNTICPRDRFAAPGWQTGHAFAVGLLIFTPSDLAAHEVVYGDRPYASLFLPECGSPLRLDRCRRCLQFQPDLRDDGPCGRALRAGCAAQPHGKRAAAGLVAPDLSGRGADAPLRHGSTGAAE